MYLFIGGKTWHKEFFSSEIRAKPSLRPKQHNSVWIFWWGLVSGFNSVNYGWVQMLSYDKNYFSLYSSVRNHLKVAGSILTLGKNNKEYLTYLTLVPSHG